jgi:DNA-binding LytR/AlgR family response regulator
MKILIVEDEKPTAEMLASFLRESMPKKISNLRLEYSLESAEIFLMEHAIDLLFLDLDLAGEDGFKLLQKVAAQSFHTIIVSAHTDQAYLAFQYGVLDFIAKPFTSRQVKKALQLYETGNAKVKSRIQFLAVRENHAIRMVEISQVLCVKARAKTSELVLLDGSVKACQKNISNLEKILPVNFLRVHRSFIANLKFILSLQPMPGRKYSLEFTGNVSIPVSRAVYSALKDKMDLNPPISE